jgi:hypothetical protein
VHATFIPHVHVPDVEQPSPVVPHVAHACPSTPHARPVGGLVQMPSVQHPAQDVGVHSHDPFMHTWPDAHSDPAPQRHPPEGEQLSARPGVHVTHAFPSVSHCMVEVGVTHVSLPTVPLQHPVGHDAELHTHWPPTHCRPG